MEAEKSHHCFLFKQLPSQLQRRKRIREGADSRLGSFFPRGASETELDEYAATARHFFLSLFLSIGGGVLIHPRPLPRVDYDDDTKAVRWPIISAVASLTAFVNEAEEEA